MEFTRRDLGKIALVSVPLYQGIRREEIDSKFGGVQIGAITYSFNRIASPDPEAIIKAYVEIGLGEAELMSNHCEALAGRPPCRHSAAAAVAARGPPAAARPADPRRRSRTAAAAAARS